MILRGNIKLGQYYDLQEYLLRIAIMIKDERLFKGTVKRVKTVHGVSLLETSWL